MSVSVTVSFSAGLFVPFRTAKRGGGVNSGGGDPVGSFYIDGDLTGDASGGTATMVLAMARLEFGFHPIFVPTHIDASDNLATAEIVQLIYDPVGNARLSAGNGIRQSKLSVAGSSTNDLLFDASGVLIEPSEVLQANVLDLVWKSNTDTKIYHFHVFGMMFDAEIMAREYVKVSELMMGVR